MIKRALAAALALLACAGAAPDGPWLGSWAAAPSPPVPAAWGRGGSPHFAGQTLRQVVRLSAGGRQVRVLVSNAYGLQPLRIGAAHVALPGPTPGTILAGSDRALTFGGQRSASVPPGAPLLSDPVDLPVRALQSLAVSLYLPSETGPCTCHPFAMQTGFLSGPVDFTAAMVLPRRSTVPYRAFVAGVQVKAAAPGRTIVVLGDSLADGAASTQDADRRWSDRLAERLVARDGDHAVWGVANAGIAGNRLLADLPGFGQSALARFDRDVLGEPGAHYLVVQIGTNDLGIGYGPGGRDPPTLAALIGGYRQLIARAHAHGLRIYGATLPPFQGAAYWSPAGEAFRQRSTPGSAAGAASTR